MSQPYHCLGLKRDKTMDDKLMCMPNNGTQNYPFCILELVVKKFEHSTWWTNQLKFTKVFKVVKPTNSTYGHICSVFKSEAFL